MSTEPSAPYPGDPDYRHRQLSRAVSACCVLVAKEVPHDPDEAHATWRDRVATYAAPRIQDHTLLCQRNVGPISLAAFRQVYGPYLGEPRWGRERPLRPEDV